MKRFPHRMPFVFLTILVILLCACNGRDCPGNLTDRADVANNPSGNDYDVYYTNTNTSADFFPPTSAGWARDALFNAHNLYVGAPYNFRNPHYSGSPNNLSARPTTT
jgi:hypothetical protein